MPPAWAPKRIPRSHRCGMRSPQSPTLPLRRQSCYPVLLSPPAGSRRCLPRSLGVGQPRYVVVGWNPRRDDVTGSLRRGAGKRQPQVGLGDRRTAHMRRFSARGRRFAKQAADLASRSRQLERLNTDPPSSGGSTGLVAVAALGTPRRHAALEWANNQRSWPRSTWTVHCGLR